MKEKHQNLVKIGNRIRELRTAKGYSQEGIADASGMGRTYMGRVERGEQNISIQNLIQSVIEKEIPILKSASMEYFLENSCCNSDSNDLTAINYFNNKEPNLFVYNNIVRDLNDIISDVKHYTEASILFDPSNHKIRPNITDNNFTEETIYNAFISYCMFNNKTPIKEKLQNICLEKPELFKSNISLADKIKTK